jgi:hypothetical protein
MAIDPTVLLRWLYREPLRPRETKLSPPMNEIAAHKRFGPLLIGPALDDQLDAAATRMVAPDAVQHLHALVEAGELSANEATRKAPGGWGFSWGSDGQLRTVYIPRD